MAATWQPCQRSEHLASCQRTRMGGRGRRQSGGLKLSVSESESGSPAVHSISPASSLQVDRSREPP